MAENETKGLSAGKWALLGCGGVLALGIFVVLVTGLWAVGKYNSLISKDQNVQEKWSQVQNVYQRRSDLVPNLVATVKAAADFEKDTFTGVAEARAKVGQMTAGPEMLKNPALFKQWQGAQQGLGTALSRLMVVVEKYPDLKANANFRDLQAQLEGTENRIAVERRTFNLATKEFNTTATTFPGVLVAGFFGDKFKTKPFFEMEEKAKTAPVVDFGGKK